ncbi:penicillin acylase family protein [Paraburkholderia sp. J12]|uniref:penicillin acylase family protein n=1 Tax=Paraburkholderia sp. J12 TaxID=2805432 RepID=UPI002ABD9895|nr:penicillin acylase family protein [Paraburkholderia sp. J12]
MDEAGIGSTGPMHVEIRRTAGGIPHIKAGDWASLGYGYGYAEATDDLCTMADAFLTWRGERSRYFGPDARLNGLSTVGQPKNIDSDFFFRLLDNDAVVERYRAAQPPQLRALVKGFASGYNRYVRELRAGDWPGQSAACRAQPWVTDITENDIYRRLYAANLAGGAAHFVEGIATAQPPAQAQLPIGLAPGDDGTGRNPQRRQLASTLAATTEGVAQRWFQAGGHEGLGSNAIAFGGDATDSNQPLLFGNPHWFWRGPDRFYQAQLTIPGKLDVSGASFLGVPVVMIGFNDSVAWTHTVSTARRFGIFQLALVPGQPTTYLYDGKPVPMTPVRIDVPVLEADGRTGTRTRTLYTTRFGPLVNLGSMSPALRWDAAHAFALRDINADNFRVFANFLQWGEARSLDEFIRVQTTLAAVPWVNTLAVARNDPRAWYADIGAVPNVPDSLAARCTTALGKAFDQGAPGVPFLDGSRSSCDWVTEPGSAQPGAMPASSMPHLLRTDYVANMNNSYWLANPLAPLTGYARIFGAVPEDIGLRARLGHQLAGQVLADARNGNGAETPETVRRVVLDSRVLSAALFKGDLLDSLCEKGSVDVANDALTHEAFSPPRTVDVGPACGVLRAWNDTGDTNARGARLWSQFWARAERVEPARRYRVPFDPADPLHTPRQLDVANPEVGEALGAAILAMNRQHVPLDSTVGDALTVHANARAVSLYGGCGEEGYFTVACAYPEPNGVARPDGENLIGSTYLQTVTFDAQGVEAHTMLATSESDDASRTDSGAGTQRYASKTWLRFPFREPEILADPELSVQVLDAAHGE